MFKLSKCGEETTLYSFCAKHNCSDGQYPAAGSTRDKSGNLYGTTAYGGKTCLLVQGGCGTVFKIDTSGQETVVYTFCHDTSCSDGADPEAGVVMDALGNLYGTTAHGGNPCDSFDNSCGTVFKIDTSGQESVLYAFCAEINCTDGGNPYAHLIMDKAGNLYGTTINDGSHCGGTVFEWNGTYQVLCDFCAQTNCTDGNAPAAGLIRQAGNLYGTTFDGGAASFGTVFKLSKRGKETVLYSFCAHLECTDGEHPQGDLALDVSGNLYSTTKEGGAKGYGTVFKLAP